MKLQDALKPDGRFSRSQFALFYFVPILITVVLAYAVGYLAWIWFLFQVYVVIVAGIRRLHDLDKSGWHLLLIFVPLVNLFMIAYLLGRPGKIEGNRWAIK
jgi:uncharacterized membrane protein YhaH (DUF805 family)